MKYGGSDLVYPFGDPINVYDEAMVVRVDGGFADMFIQFDKELNLFVVNQNSLTPDFIGAHLIRVTASYEGPKGTVTLKASFMLSIEPEDVDPDV